MGPTAEHGPEAHHAEDWIKLDGTRDASLLNGKLVIYRRTATPGSDRLMSLPSDPQKLRTLVYKKVDATPVRDRMTKDRDGQAFRDTAQMLWNAPATIPPATRAALYQVLAAIRGVQIHRNVKDGAGRPAVALSHGFGEQYLLDLTTYQMVAQRTVNTGRNAPISATKGREPPLQRPGGNRHVLPHPRGHQARRPPRPALAPEPGSGPSARLTPQPALRQTPSACGCSRLHL